VDILDYVSLHSHRFPSIDQDVLNLAPEEALYCMVELIVGILMHVFIIVVAVLIQGNTHMHSFTIKFESGMFGHTASVRGYFHFQLLLIKDSHRPLTFFMMASLRMM
jgi:hypothetical protein